MGKAKGAGARQRQPPPPSRSSSVAGSASGPPGGGRGGDGLGPHGGVAPEVAEWFEKGRIRMMEACEERNPSIVGDAVKAQEAKQRLADLSQRGNDTKGVSFAGDALHHLYFSTKFERRGILLYRILAHLLLSSPTPSLQAAGGVSSCGAALRAEICRQESGKAELLAVSVGGGPGTDSSGLYWANKHFLGFKGTAPAEEREGGRLDGGLHCVLLDKEKSWRRNLATLQALMLPEVTLDFAPCDVGQHCASPQNGRASADIFAADLIIFAYVCHETSEVARSSDFAFYRGVCRGAKKGAVMLFMDVMGHSQPLFQEIYRAMRSELGEEAAAGGRAGGGGGGDGGVGPGGSEGERVKGKGKKRAGGGEGGKTAPAAGNATGGGGQEAGAAGEEASAVLDRWVIAHEDNADIKAEVMVLRVK